jgi:phosphatidylserine decarboxylase
VKELLIYGGGSLLAGVAALNLLPWAAFPFFLLTLFLLSFFRDPERSTAGGPQAAVAPADGKVTDIEVVEEPHFVGGRALRIGIFLSVFNVHVNRAPLDGRVQGVRYAPGAFHDARDPECVEQNEANLIGFSGDRGPFAVRQVAGLIARRIVCPLAEGDEVRRGDRMGMIKFGSRTELLLPADAPVDIDVKVGQTVKGGETVLLRFLS